MGNKRALEKSQKAKAGKRLIPGIHNFCDRWCDRCTLSERCSIFAFGKEEERILAEGRDPGAEMSSFVGTMLKDAFRLLNDLALEHGLENNPFADNHDTDVPQEQDHYLLRTADDHAGWMQKWKDRNSQRINSILLTLEETSMENYALLKDAMEVLGWYMNFIVVKFSRALHSNDAAQGALSDSLGSAKIAVIAVERSIESLRVVQKFISDDAGELKKSIARLERIRKRALKEFPGLVEFKRPGFDF